MHAIQSRVNPLSLSAAELSVTPNVNANEKRLKKVLFLMGTKAKKSYH
jgi:hypothetical protein